MARYAALKTPFLAFYSWDLYRDVAAHWRAKSFAYLLALLAICWIPSAVQIHRGWATIVDKKSGPLVDQIPPITITQGTVTVDASQPVYITDPDSKKVMVIIDTTGQVTSLDGTGALVFLGKDQIVIRKSPQETRILRLSGVEYFHVDRDVARLWLHQSTYIVSPFFYLSAVAGAFVYRFVEVLLLAGFGAAESKRLKMNPGFGALSSVAVLAITPPIVLQTVFGLARVTIPMSWPVFLIMTAGYMLYGLHALRAPRSGPEGELVPEG